MMEYRAATTDDKDRLLDMLRQSYSWPRPPSLDFLRMYPHLFHPRRIVHHHLAVEDGNIIAVVGAYPYDIVLDGLTFPGAAIGQIATSPQWRRQGVMGKLLANTLVELESKGRVLTWLRGDSRRYGAYGYSSGGVTVRYELSAERVNDAPLPDQVRRMTKDEVLHTVLRHRTSLRHTLLVEEAELAQIIAAQEYCGHHYNDAWIVHDARGGLVHFAGGAPQAIDRLLSFLLARAPMNRNGQFVLHVECADEPTGLGRACLAHYPSIYRRPSCLWRIGPLIPFLHKLCEIGNGRVGGGTDSISVINIDTEERATLECRGGELQVRSDGCDTPIELDTRGLSALCFGGEPIEYLLPSLGLDSPFRQVFPISAHHTWFAPV